MNLFASVVTSLFCFVHFVQRYQTRVARINSANLLNQFRNRNRNCCCGRTSPAALLTATTTMSISARQDSGIPNNLIERDNYNGIILRYQSSDGISANDFRERLSDSLVAWREEGKRGIWIHLPTDSSQLVPVCTELGFDFHSAQSGKVVLTQWLDSSTPSRLPLGPTHQVGIGCLVINADKKMLVVKEKTGPAAKYNLWKLPTGLLDPGEDIPTAAERELKEETGLDGKLTKILCARHATGLDGRVSDLFFICLMKLPEYPQTTVKCEEEIADLQWMTFDEYCSQDRWTKSPLYDEMHQAMIVAIEQGGMQAKQMELGFRPGSQTIYISPDLGKEDA